MVIFDTKDCPTSPINREVLIVQSIPNFVKTYPLDNGTNVHRLIGDGFLDD